MNRFTSLVCAVVALSLVSIASHAHGQWVDSAALDARLTAVEARVSTLEKRLGTQTVSTPAQKASVKSAVSISRSHWTHPDTIANHLNSEQHAAEVAALGVSLVGMSEEQMLTLHDQLHESRGKTVSKTVRSTSVPLYSGNCPGGVCPVQSSQRTVTRSRSGWYMGKNLGL